MTIPQFPLNDRRHLMESLPHIAIDFDASRTKTFYLLTKPPQSHWRCEGINLRFAISSMSMMVNTFVLTSDEIAPNPSWIISCRVFVIADVLFGTFSFKEKGRKNSLYSEDSPATKMAGRFAPDAMAAKVGSATPSQREHAHS